MKTHIKLFILVLFVVLLFPTTFTFAQSTTVAELFALIENLKSQITQLQEEVNSLKSEVKEVREEIKFIRTLQKGASGEDVEALQEFLSQFSDIYPEGLVTGYYGPLTEKAIRRFQEKHGIVSSGNPNTTGFGLVGPKTRSKLNELMTEGAGKSEKEPPGLFVAHPIQIEITDVPATSTPPVPLPNKATSSPQTETPSGTIPATPAVPAIPSPSGGGSSATPATHATPAEPATSTPPAPEPEPEPEPEPTPPSVAEDSFDTYTDGSIVGQGDWTSYANGDNFVVQSITTFDGTKALYNNTLADSVITRAGNVLSDGVQTVYVQTAERENWGTYADGNAQVRMSKGPWGTGGVFTAVSFKNDGNVAYYNPTSDAYENFATYNDGEWILLTIEWRSSDNTARYKVDTQPWTDWHVFYGNVDFTNFDNVGFDFVLPSGSGGVYFDTLR